MSAPTQNPALANLAYWWQSVEPGMKVIFNQLYEEAPELVIRVLSHGEVDGNSVTGATLNEVFNANPDPYSDDIAFADITGVFISEITFDPPNPASGEDFTVSWRRQVNAPLPDSFDAVQVLGSDGSPVDEQFVTFSAIGENTTTTETVTVQGLGPGVYSVVVWGNSEGYDGSGTPTAQGQRMSNMQYLSVGDTAEGQSLVNIPLAGSALADIQNASYTIEPLQEALENLTPDERQANYVNVPVGNAPDQFVGAIGRATESLRQIDGFGDGMLRELDEIDNKASAVYWPNIIQQDQVASTIQRLRGIGMMPTDAPGDIVVALSELLDDLLP